MSDTQLRTIEDFLRLSSRNALCHVVRAAVDLSLLDALEERQKTARELAEELSLDRNAAARLLDVLATTELVEKYGDDYALSSIARLIPGPFRDFGDAYWQYLTSHVRSGTSLANDESIPHTEADFLATQSHKEWMLTPVALNVADALDIGQARSGIDILDLGCGTAVFGITLIHRDPTSSLTLLDDSAGLRRASQTLASVQPESPVTCLEGQWDEMAACEELSPPDQPLQFDLVLLANRLHRRNAGQCRQIIQELAKHIRPDGELAIVDVFPGKDQADQHRHLLSLELGLRTATGTLHAPQELQGILESSGFGGIQFAHLPAAPGHWGIMLGTRL